MSEDGSFSVPTPLIALAGWFVPGLGYVLAGQRTRGIIAGVTIITLFLSGVLIGGVRVIDVPGYGNTGLPVMIVVVNNTSTRVDPPIPNIDGSYNGSWALTNRFYGEVINKPWYIAQILGGPMCVGFSGWSLSAARHAVPRSHARLYEIGTLYTAVAGMLNLLTILDATSRKHARAA